MNGLRIRKLEFCYFKKKKSTKRTQNNKIIYVIHSLHTEETVPQSTRSQGKQEKF